MYDVITEFGQKWEEPAMSDLFPKTPSDERDPQEDKNDELRRENELNEGRPPHYED